jgi:2-polyprenyl-3-methyl-5-hydroxy-6-metoxy-1,4-benzoquinol methylase
MSRIPDPKARRPATDASSGGPSADEEVAAAWDANAAFWDKQMGEGNLTHRHLVSPTIERLLQLTPGESILEIACGNGQLARRLAELGAKVLATDLSEQMLLHARSRSGAFGDRIEYRRLNASDPVALAGVGTHRFAAVVCSMAMMDMAEVRPLAEALPRLLNSEGRFVFSVTHPCFNSTGIRRIREEQDVGGVMVEHSGVFVFRYATPTNARGLAMIGQPQPQPYFDRPLNELLRPFFRAGLALDGLEEPVFPPELPPNRPMSTIGFREIPQILAGRMRVRTGPR